MKVQLSVLDEPTLPDPFQAITNSDIEEAGDENTMVLDEDSTTTTTTTTTLLAP